MRKIIISPDSFKGSISASDAASAIALGIHDALPDAVTLEVPVADGGEGTLDALVPKETRTQITVRRTDGKAIEAEFGYINDTAVIEMAAAAGLCTVPESERNPEASTTYGVGQLINAALNDGFRKLLITVGGSGSNDGGIGMLEALGAVFLDANGKPISDIRAGQLGLIDRIDISGLDKRLYESEITLACDVTNPSVGKLGATYIYGPQKGADIAMQERLEAGMRHYLGRLADVACDTSRLPGGGAGGGLPAPLVAIFGAKVHSGIDSVLEALDYSSLLEAASLVITGEGRIDRQSVYGKAVGGVAATACAKGIPVAVIAGCRGAGADELLHRGVNNIFTLDTISPDLDYSLTHPAELLRRAAAQVCILLLNKGII